MVKPISFKDEKESDLIEYLKNSGYLKNFSYYVKGLIRKDMEKENINESTSKIEKVAPKRRNVNFDI